MDVYIAWPIFVKVHCFVYFHFYILHCFLCFFLNAIHCGKCREGMSENEYSHNTRDIFHWFRVYLRQECMYSDEDIFESGQYVSCIVKIIVLILTLFLFVSRPLPLPPFSLSFYFSLSLSSSTLPFSHLISHFLLLSFSSFLLFPY